MTREGNLEAPTRHPIDWKSPEFYDEEKCLHEMERTFDICHGCRRCVSLCQSFPTLFDLVDESKTQEVDGVAKADYWKVVDQCYLCDLCYMTKCPYVPPHPWNLDFPHTMLRAKAIKFKQGEVGAGDPIEVAEREAHGVTVADIVALYLADAAVWIEDRDRDAVSTLEAFECCLARVARSRDQNHRVRALADGGLRNVHELGHDLQRDILERSGRAVK